MKKEEAAWREVRDMDMSVHLATRLHPEDIALWTPVIMRALRKAGRGELDGRVIGPLHRVWTVRELIGYFGVGRWID